MIEKNLEDRFFTEEQFKQILEQATLNKASREEREKKGDMFQAINYMKNNELFLPESGYTESVIMEATKGLYSPEDVSSAIYCLFSTREEQLRLIKEHNSLPTNEVILKDYYNRLKKSLFSFKDILMDNSKYTIFEISKIKIKKKKNWFFKDSEKIINIKKLAKIIFHKELIDVDYYDPFILTTCSDVILGLKEKYKDYYSVRETHSFLVE